MIVTDDFDKFSVISDEETIDEYSVDGTTYSPQGSIKSCVSNKSLTSSQRVRAPLLLLAEISSICNDAKVIYNEV